jgi:large subunit ribosomal protein L30e
VDVKKQLNIAIDTGEGILGSKKTIDSLLYGAPKMVFLAGNCPRQQKDSLQYYCRLAGVTCVALKENSMELGSSCGRPHPISALAVVDAGESTVLEARE